MGERTISQGKIVLSGVRYWNLTKQKLFEDILLSVFSGCIKERLRLIIYKFPTTLCAVFEHHLSLEYIIFHGCLWSKKTYLSTRICLCSRKNPSKV
jgi:hypothetical protein